MQTDTLSCAENCTQTQSQEREADKDDSEHRVSFEIFGEGERRRRGTTAQRGLFSNRPFPLPNLLSQLWFLQKKTISDPHRPGRSAYREFVGPLAGRKLQLNTDSRPCRQLLLSVS